MMVDSATSERMQPKQTKKMKWRKALLCFRKEKKTENEMKADVPYYSSRRDEAVAAFRRDHRQRNPRTRERESHHLRYDLESWSIARRPRAIARPVGKKKFLSDSQGNTGDSIDSSRFAAIGTHPRLRTSSDSTGAKSFPTKLPSMKNPMFASSGLDDQEVCAKSRRSLPIYLVENQGTSMETIQQLPLFFPEGLYPEIIIPGNRDDDTIEDLSTPGLYSETSGLDPSMSRRVHPSACMTMGVNASGVYHPDGLLEATILRADSSKDMSTVGEAFHVSVYNFSERMSYDLTQASRNLTTVAGKVARACSAQTNLVKKK